LLAIKQKVIQMQITLAPTGLIQPKNAVQQRRHHLVFLVTKGGTRGFTVTPSGYQHRAFVHLVQLQRLRSGQASGQKSLLPLLLRSGFLRLGLKE